MRKYKLPDLGATREPLDINNRYIWLLVLYPIVFNILFILAFFISFMMMRFTNEYIARGFYIIMLIILFIALPIRLFILDRNALKEIGAIVPSWGWYFLFPVYVFRRQYLNKFSLNIFWIYMVTTFIILPVVMGILSSFAK